VLSCCLKPISTRLWVGYRQEYGLVPGGISWNQINNTYPGPLQNHQHYLLCYSYLLTFWYRGLSVLGEDEVVKGENEGYLYCPLDRYDPSTHNPRLTTHNPFDPRPGLSPLPMKFY